MRWFYADKGKSIGPVSEDEFHNLVASGNIKPQTLVWHEGMKEWAKYGTIIQQADAVNTQTAEEPDAAAAGGIGETHNRDLMAQARAALRGRWALAIGTLVVAGSVYLLAAAIPVIGVLISFVICGALALGLATFFLAIARGHETQLAVVFEGFQRFGTALGAYFMVTLFTILWSLLLVIPGIIASLSYSMTYYIIADNPSIGCLDAISRSKEMMNGMKWKFFCLNLRFVPWKLLIIAPFFAMGPLATKLFISLATSSPAAVLSVIGGAMLYVIAALLWVCIGSLWLAPYMNCTMAKFYDDVKGRCQE